MKDWTPSPQDLARFNADLVIAHSFGVGTPLPVPVTRLAMAIRANTMLAGHTGSTPGLARQLVADVQRLALPHRASSVAHVVTVSIGAASLRPAHGRNPDALLHAADAALYCAKAEGRNRALPAK